MSIVDLLAFISLSLVCYASVRFSRLVYGDYLAPMGLFFGANLASLSLYQLNLLPITPVSAQAYALFVVSLFSFFVGALFTSPFFVLKGKSLTISGVSSRCQDISEGLRLFYYLTALVGIAGWIFYVTVIVPPGWLTNLSMLQGNYVFPYHLGYTLVLSSLVPPTFVLLALTRNRITIPSVCILVASVITMGLSGNKSYLILGLASSLLIWSIVRPGRIRLWRHLAFFVACLIGFMVLYDHFIDLFVPHQFPESGFPDALSFLERPYFYIVGPLSIMSATMADPPAQVQWGEVTLAFVWKILGPGGLGIRDWRVPEFNPFVDIGASDGGNAYTLIGDVYWDYGWVGAILVCFLLGFVSTRLYIMARKHNNWILYLFSALFSYGLFLSFFVYYYRSNLIVLLLYIIVIGYMSKIASGFVKRNVAYVLHSLSAYRKGTL